MNNKVILKQCPLTLRFIVSFNNELKEFNTFKEADIYVENLIRSYSLIRKNVRNMVSEG